jgi:hypothetical protein
MASELEVGLAAAGVKITSPANGSTVSNGDGPPIKVCVTGSNGACETNGIYTYELFINSVKKLTQVGGSPWIYTPSPSLSGGSYEVYVKATLNGPGGAAFQSNPVTFTVTVAELDTFILDPKPASPTKETSASFAFEANDANAQFKCALNGPGTSWDHGFTNCSSPKSYNGLGHGEYQFSVKAVDAAGNEDSTPASHTWEVDTSGPDVRIVSSPQPLTRETSATFSFESSEIGARFKCSLDGTSPSDCASPVRYTGLSVGAHSFSVLAEDVLGNQGPAARKVWNIYKSKPVTRVLSPVDGDLVNTRTPVIIGAVVDGLTGDPESGSTVDVFIDDVSVGQATTGKDGKWSFQTATLLRDGLHRAIARATDRDGNMGDLSTPNQFTVDTESPETVILNAPPKIHNSRLAAFEFGSPSGEAEFECRSDGATVFKSCPSAHVLTQLSDGDHTLQVRARDKAGNVDPTPEIYQWTVVIRPPSSPEVVEPADGAVVDSGTPAVTGRAVPRSTVTIYIDGAKSGVAQADDSGNWTFRPPTPLGEGEHTLSTEATDEAGNTSEQRSEESVFRVLLRKGEAHAIGGGLSCAASGAQLLPAWWLLGGGLWLVRRRRSRAPLTSS